MLALAHIPTGVTANEGLNIDEVNNRFAEQAVALTATGADIPRRMGAAHRFGGARQPGVGMVEFAPSIRRRDPIGRPVQYDRKARAATFRQEHKRVEPSAVAHRHYGLK